MLTFSPISPPSPVPLLTAGLLRAGLESRGYRCTTALLPGVRALAPGCMVALQFGDQVAMKADGTTCLTVRGSIQINGSDERVGGITYLQVRKLFNRLACRDRLCFAVEADLILGGGISLAEGLALGDDIHRHMQILIGDASATLHDLSIDERERRDIPPVMAPVMRIDARFLGDLAAGRSGLVTSGGAGRATLPAKVAARHLQITRMACDWLKDDILPDLASAVRRLTLQAQTTLRYRVPANVEPDQKPPAGEAPKSWPHDPSIQATDDVAATLVPEQVR